MTEEESDYISLRAATKYCSYSQEYLALRVRQEKLKAVKFGRNWVTKKEWLEEYLKKVEEYNHNLKIKKFASGPSEPTVRRIVPPENLPVETPTPKPVPAIRFGFIVVLVFVALITGIFYERGSFKIVYDQVTPLVIKFNENFEKTVPDTIFSAVVNAQDIWEVTVDTFKEFGQWLISPF